MPFSFATPLWLVALVFAAFAPWCVRAYGDAIERTVHRRTIALLKRAGVSPKLAGASKDRTRALAGATLEDAASKRASKEDGAANEDRATNEDRAANEEGGVAIERRGEREA